MRKFRHFLEYLLAFFMVMMLLFVITSVVIVKFYGDDLRRYALDAVNEQLDTKVEVEEVGFGILKSFPYTSVNLKNVVVWSGHGFNRGEFTSVSTDTLLTANSISIQFNLPDLLRKRYRIRGFEVNRGKAWLLTDSEGKNNFQITKKVDREKKSELMLHVKGLNFRELSLLIVNHAKKMESGIVLNSVQLDGNFYATTYNLDLTGSTRIKYFRKDEITYVNNQNIKGNISLEVDDNLYSIAHAGIDLGSISANISGNMLLGGVSGSDLNLHLDAGKIDISWLIGELKKRGITALNGIKASGTGSISANITGITSALISPHIEAQFNLTSNSVISDKIPVAISGVNLEGSYSNGSLNSGMTSELRLNKLNFQMLHSVLETTLSINDFTDPSYKLTVSGAVDPKDILAFVPDLPITISSGILYPDLSLNGRIEGVIAPPMKITFIPRGSLLFSDISMEHNELSLNIKALKGSLSVENNLWKSWFEGVLNGSDFRAVASHNNPFGYLSGQSELDLDASLEANRLNIDEFIRTPKNGKQQDGSWHPSKRINLKLALMLENLHYKKLDAQKVKAVARYSYPSLYLDQLTLQSGDGSLSATGGLTNLDSDIKSLTVNSDIRRMDIQNLFITFNNFNQESLTGDNIKGNLTATTAFVGKMDSSNRLITSSIVAENSILIENGELNNFEPLIKMSDFLKIEKMDRVKFSSLENNILVSNNSVTIPEMEIKSNALNISASGIQGFDKTYNYHLAIKLSEILFKKAQSASKKEFEVALDENDRRTLFLILYDKGKGMQIEFDEDQAMKKIRNDLKEEKQELKVILNEEFGMFKKDQTTLEHKKEEAPVFKFEFADEEKEEKAPEMKQSRKWWKKEKDKKQEIDFVIENSEL